MNKNSIIWVAGHRGLVGSAIVRKLTELGYNNVITTTRQEVDLLNYNQVIDFFDRKRPEFVFLAAAKVGGIKANSEFGADFIYENTVIQTNVIKSCHLYGVKKMIFLGSSCIYPKFCEQPIKEEYLLSGYLESTNEAYAIAKISGIKMCQSFNSQYNTNFVSVMPCNIYGPGDNYDSNNSHVFPAIIKKLHDSKISGSNKIELWGDGQPYREFLFSEDLADACHFLMINDCPDLINVGTGQDHTIKDIAYLIKSIIYPECEIVFNGNKSINGTPKKLLDVSLINSMGWTSQTSLVEGIIATYKDYISRI